MNRCKICNTLMQMDDIYYDPQDVFFDTPMCFDCSPGDWLGEELMLEDIKKLIEEEEDGC